MESKAPRAGLASLISKWRTVLSWNAGETDTGDFGDAPVSPVSSWDAEWRPDALLKGFECRTYSMPGQVHIPEEPEGHLVATLVRHRPDSERRAVLYVHGWNEYFFQEHVASFYEELGYDFYAIDLHRYGRSLQDGELPGYMESIDDYYEELDAAVEFIRRTHSQVLLYAHSTGGLTAAVYAGDRPKTFVGVILNSPWLDMQGSFLLRALTPTVSRGLSVASPTMVLPAMENDLYGRSLHVDYFGEWEYDLDLKRIESRPLRPGWTKAITAGHDKVAAGLRIDCPVLVVTSARSSSPKEWCEEAGSTDLALDVERIAARAHLLGWHVTLVRLQGALHDVSLSRLDVRERFFDEIRRWELSYARTKSARDQDAEP